MDESKKTKKQLIEELKKLRKEIAGLEEFQSKSKETEKELIRERALFKSFMDHIPISVYFKDKEGRFLRVSEYFLKQKGVPQLGSVEKLIGKTDFDLFSKEHAELAYEDELMVMKTGKPIIEREEESKTEDGEKVYLLTSKAPLTDEKGNTIGIVGMTKEVTEKKLSDEEIKERLEKLGEEIVFKSRLLSALFENIPDHIYFKDKKSRFVAVSKALARWLGAEKSDDMIGKTDFDYFTEEHAKPAYKDEQEVMKKGEEIEGKIERETYSDGRVTWVSTTKIPWYDENGNIIGTFGISRDITELKNKEFELIEAREISQKASQAKTTFLAIMSHEIRTPLNAIIGMCEILEETVLSKEQHEYLKILREAGETLLAIINDVLDISKIECGDVQIEKSEFSLDSLVEKVCDILAIRAHKKGIELADHVAPNVPVNLIGDSYRMRQILVNLIGNSIKFTDEGEIVLSIRIAEEENNQIGPKEKDEVCLLFSVKDTGVGIPEEKQEAIFDSFKQADSSTTRKFGGTGLGLSISKRLVELMGGKMWVESEEGKGSEFFFTVRFGIQKTKKTRTFIEPREVDVRGIATLIVDDNATNRLILKEILTAWDADVTEASGGKEAISMIRSARKKGKHFRLILLDRRMPATDGFKVAEVIREDKKSEETTTVMMLTSDHRISDLNRIDELGINCYLVKPIKRDELKNAILATLGLWKARKEKTEISKTKVTDLPPMKILLVEDTEDNRLLIEAFLKKSSVEIDEAENGKIAFEKFKKNVYDLVLMDMQMPVMDGYTATKKIRAWEKRVSAEETPIIALTAFALRGDAEKCLDAGCNTHVAKPVKMETLLDVLKEFADKIGL
jgi:two-component system sensor histidine kinase/response regulator